MKTRSWLLADSICRLRPTFAESRFSASPSARSADSWDPGDSCSRVSRNKDWFTSESQSFHGVAV